MLFAVVQLLACNTGFLSRTYVPLACPTVDKSCSTTRLWIERTLRKPYSSQESSIYH